MNKTPKVQQIIRHGAYGIILRNSHILLTQKRSGPYKGLWGLPGGSIEFGESPEDALRRELLDEAALEAGEVEFSNIATSTGEYDNNGERYGFHQVGLIYDVTDWTEQADLVPQEEKRWVSLKEIAQAELTPFARHAISNHIKEPTWRPSYSIQGKVVGLAKHEGRLLVCEVLNDDGIVKGWCLLGGGIEFGETAEDALRRGILKELGCGIVISGLPIVCENIFEHHGFQGHEIVFAFPITLDNPQIYANHRFQIREHKGSTHWVEWITIERFESKECMLFPLAIAEKVKDGLAKVKE
jgi:ADP-ribose pyrophosphatase YjhB (NUDIX family)